MSSAEIGLAASVFLACAVESVEALTIVLAVGVTRGWRSTMQGVAAALLALAAIVGALGPTIVLVPLGGLRIAVGGLLLVVGVQWLRKAILRAAGVKAPHDELRIYAEQVQEADALNSRARPGSFDRYGFAVAFKGVLLEGFEVVVIVLTLGSGEHRVGLAALAAVAAVALVATVGVMLRAPLARVPENTLKLLVGVMLTAFGCFWVGEGAGVAWPGGEAALFAIAAGVLAGAGAMALAIRRAGRARNTRQGAETAARKREAATMQQR